MAALRTPAEIETGDTSQQTPDRPQPQRSGGRARRMLPADMPYINRELSWLEFNDRVLFEAVGRAQPAARSGPLPVHLREQPRRVLPGPRCRPEAAGRGRQIQPDSRRHGRRSDSSTRSERGSCRWSPATRTRSRRSAHELADEGIRIVRYDERPERHVELRRRFFDEIFPVLTPLAVDPGHPFPYISDLSLSLAVTVRDPQTGERLFARIKVPPILPRLMEVGQRTYVLLEQVIAANLDALFPGMEVARAPPLPRDAQRRPLDRGGRGARPARWPSRRSCASAASARWCGSRSSARCLTRRARC